MTQAIDNQKTTQNLYQPLSLRKIDADLLAFWLPYVHRLITFDVPLNDAVHIKITPYYGFLFNEYDVIGQDFTVELDFGSDEPVTMSFPVTLLSLILGSYLDPLLPEHFDDNFVCNILEIILVDVFTTIKTNTGIMPRFRAFSGVMGGFKSAWRVYINDNKDFYPVLIMGKQEIIHDLLRHVFAKAKLKPAIRTSLPLKVICVARKISTRQLRRLRLGEIIILMTKRHPINEPLVIIGDTIVCHTILNGMELHLIKDPSLLKDVEELNMTIHDDDINALSQRQSEEFNADETQANSALVNAMNDYKVTVTFELNRLDMATHLIEQLREGSVINLQKEITEDIFLTVSGRTIAVGEVVQVGRNFGVLIKEIF